MTTETNGFWAEKGAEIRKWRRGVKDFTQSELGAFLGGISKDAVSRIERGYSRPTVAQAAQLERAMQHEGLVDFYFSKAEQEL